MKVTFEGSIHEILDQIEHFTKSIITAWSEPVKVKQKPAKKVKVVDVEQAELTRSMAIAEAEQEPDPEIPEDLLAATMAIVNGDKEKKAILMEILSTLNVKTIGTIPDVNKLSFWNMVNQRIVK